MNMQPKEAATASSPQTESGSETALDKVDFKSRKAIVAIVAAIIVVAVVAAFVLLNQGKTDTGDGYVLSNQKIETVDGSKTVTGTIKNTCGREETFMITWTVFDADGNEIGSAMAAAGDLADGASTRVRGVYLPGDDYDVWSFDEKASSFELDSVLLLKAENARLQAQLSSLMS